MLKVNSSRSGLEGVGHLGDWWEVRRVSSMRAKGRYLFALSRFEAVLSVISTSSEVDGGAG